MDNANDSCPEEEGDLSEESGIDSDDTSLEESCPIPNPCANLSAPTNLGQLKTGSTLTQPEGEKCQLDEAILYLSCSSEMSFDDVFATLKEPLRKKVTYVPPVRPGGGHVFVFSPSVDQTTRRCDQYHWLADGAKNLPRADPIVKKRYFVLLNQDGTKCRSFKKHEYELLSECMELSEGRYVLVQYIGDETFAGANAPHGNAKNRRAPFIRTFGTVKKVVTDAGFDVNPIKIYRRMITGVKCPGAAEPTAKPRDHEQVRNFQKSAKRRFRISHDGLYNCLELAYQFPEYVRYVQIHPSLVIFLVDDAICREMVTTNAARMHSKEGQLSQLQYDTTFALGNFYVSTLSFRHGMFEGEPIIPVAFMVHERKFQRDHVRFMEFVAEKYPALKKQKFSMVTDSEFAFGNVFPNATTLHCWNHVRRDIRFWLRKRQASSDDLRVYSDQTLRLLSCMSEAEFDEQYEKLSTAWSAPFKEYFDKHVKPNILGYAGRWILESAGQYNSSSGITTNSSESLNKVLHDLSDWKESPIDALLVSFQFLQAFYMREITRGKHGMGIYCPKKEFDYMIQPANLIPTALGIKSPEEIVQYVKDGIVSKQAQRVSVLDSKQTSADTGLPYKQSRAAQDVLAKELVESGRIAFVPNLKSFMADGSEGKKYAVTLFPKESCPCPSTATCYHILAAKLLMGMPTNPCPTTKNLSLLRKKRMGKGNQRSGRKKPRPGDYEVIPAPDSADIAGVPCHTVDADVQLIGSNVVDSQMPSFAKPGQGNTSFASKLSIAATKSLISMAVVSPTCDCPVPRSIINQICIVEIEGCWAVLQNRSLNPACPTINVFTGNRDLASSSMLQWHAASYATPNQFCKEVNVAINLVNPNSGIDKVVNSLVSPRMTLLSQEVIRCKVAIRCICRKPCIKGIFTQQMLPCHALEKSVVCYLDYHIACQPACLSQQEGWVCPICTAPQSLPTWGSNGPIKARNTCPFDNMIVAVAIHDADTGNIISRTVDPKQRANSCLVDAVRKITAGNGADGKDQWMMFLMTQLDVPKSNDGCFDFHGTEYDNFFRYFQNSWTIDELSTCEAVACPEQIQRRSRCVFAASSADDIEAFSQNFRKPHQTTCSLGFGKTAPTDGSSYFMSPSRDEKTGKTFTSYCCASKRIFSPISFRTLSGVWCIPFQIGATALLADAMRFPLLLQIEDIHFVLRAITCYSAVGDHFTVLVRLNGSWLYYDVLRMDRLSWFDDDAQYSVFQYLHNFWS